jgi:hypothetical protein
MSIPRKQVSLTAQQLHSVFQDAVEDTAKGNRKQGITEMIEMISETVHMCQQNGIDISFDLRTGDYSNAYDMIFTAENNKNTHSATQVSMPVYGFLHIGPNTRLIAIANRINSEPATRMYISEHNTHESESRMEWSNTQKVPAIKLDFAVDENALLQFQEIIVRAASRQTAAMQADTQDVFNRPAPGLHSLKKPLAVQKPLNLKKPG